MRYRVIPTSTHGHSLLESIERRGENPHIARISLQMPTEAAEEIVKAVELWNLCTVKPAERFTTKQ